MLKAKTKLTSSPNEIIERAIQVRTGRSRLDGDLAVPPGARGVVLVAHGTGSSRHSSRNRHVAAELQGAGYATLLLDLLTSGEERLDSISAQIRFDIPLLGERVVHAVEWVREQAETKRLPLGLFGASSGAAAAIVAAAERPREVTAIVSRGGRPDLAGSALERVRAPTLLIVGGADEVVLDLNREALSKLRCTSALEIVPGATHLFEEEGALERVSRLAREWFGKWMLGGA